MSLAWKVTCHTKETRSEDALPTCIVTGSHSDALKVIVEFHTCKQQQPMPNAMASMLIVGMLLVPPPSPAGRLEALYMAGGCIARAHTGRSGNRKPLSIVDGWHNESAVGPLSHLVDADG